MIMIIIILYYAKMQHNHYKYNIQSIKPQKEEKKKRKKLVRKSGKTVKLSVQTVQMLHCVSNIKINKTFKKSGKTVTQNIQCPCLFIVSHYHHHHGLLRQ